MALTTVNFNAVFANHLATKRFSFTDLTDYAGQGSVIANAKVTIKVTAPTGVIYDNLGNVGSPDIVPNTSRNNTTTILVPLVAGKPEVGVYTFEVSVYDGVNTVNLEKTFTYSFASPSVTITQDINCIAPRLSNQDTTNYVVANVAPSSSFAVTDASSASDYFKVTGDATGLFQAGVTFSVAGSTGNNTDYTVVTSSYDQSANKTQINVATVASSTGDGIIYVKYNKIFYPQVLGLSPIVGYTTLLQTNSFYNKTHEFSVSTTNLYSFGNGIYIVDKTSNTAEADINCDVMLCDVYCCIATVRNNWFYSIGTNKTMADIYERKYVLITSLLSELRNAFECNQASATSVLTNKILEIAECEAGCGCNDNTPTPISGVGGAANNVVVESAGNGISVTSNVAGSTTTYTLGLTPAIIASMTGKYNTNMVDTADIIVNETTNVDGSKTYAPTLANAAATPKDTSAFRTTLVYSNPTVPAVAVTVSNTTVVGPNLQIASVQSMNTGDLNFANLGNYFRVYNFQVASNNTYKVDMKSTVLEYTDRVTGTVYDAASIANFGSMLTLELLDQKSGQFFFRFVDSKTGVPFTNKQMTYYTNILLNILIAE